MTPLWLNFSQKAVRAFWDRIAEKYDHFNQKHYLFYSQRFREALKIIKIKPQSKILNIFSRTSELLKFLPFLETLQVVNAEISFNMLRVGARKFPGGTFLLVSPSRLPFLNETFDIIISLETLEHIPSPGLFLQELHRVLKSPGQLLLSLPGAWSEYAAFLSSFFHHGEGPHKFWSEKVIKKLLKEKAFLLLEHRATLFLPLPFGIALRVNEIICSRIQKSFLRNFCLRHFYLVQKSEKF
jgi:SAM-dependent methyltransferase